MDPTKRLAVKYPDIADEWHPIKNGRHTPYNTTYGASYVAWWVCPSCKYEYTASVSSRTSAKSGCPRCNTKRLYEGINDLATTHPSIAREWHPTKNGDKTPSKTIHESAYKAWWLCVACGYEYAETVSARTSENRGCPRCTIKGNSAGTASLAILCPDIASEWHPTKNGYRTPHNTTSSSAYEAWWECAEQGHEYTARVYNRTINQEGCPFCAAGKRTSKPKPIPLAKSHPKFAAEWHPTLNGNITPYNTPYNSSDKAWWICADGHEYKARISDRTSKGGECPRCVKERQSPGFAYLETSHPKLAAEWHPTRNGEKNPQNTSRKSKYVAWWICDKGHEYTARVCDRMSKKSQCPICVSEKQTMTLHYLNTTHPELADEWHPTKNGERTPWNTSKSSHFEAWWLCPNGHEYTAIVRYRTTHGNVCPYCSGKLPIPGSNDLATTNPTDAAEWHPTKNGDKTPETVTNKSNYPAWWICAAKGHEYQSRVKDKIKSSLGCPICRGSKLVVGVNDLATLYPDLAKEWHPTKNGDATPETTSYGSRDSVWWRCTNAGHEFNMVVRTRAQRNSPCPVCIGRITVSGDHSLASSYPQIAKEWHPTKNGDLTPDKITYGAGRTVWWLCANGHEFEATVTSRTAQQAGCPYCTKQKIIVGFNDLATTHPDLVAEWDEEKNEGRLPTSVSQHSRNIVWWKCSEGHQWLRAIYRRTEKMESCPECTQKKLLLEGSLSVTNPDVARDWHPTKNGDKKPEDFLPNSRESAWWQCENGHEWNAQIFSRTHGNVCPECFVILRGGHPDPKRIPVYERSLEARSPEVAKTWHPTKNAPLTPSTISASSGKRLWWRCEKGHEWESAVVNRVHSPGAGCPYCAGQKVCVGENDLATTFPDVARTWHPTKNEGLTPEMVTAKSNKVVWWICDSKHEYQSKIGNETRKGDNTVRCPFCCGNKLLKGYNDLETLYPGVAKDWHPTANGDLLPSDFLPSAKTIVTWRCEKGHEVKLPISSRVDTGFCAFCSGARVYENLATSHPNLAKEWHPTLNGVLTPNDVSRGSNLKVWWLCENGHEFQTRVQNRATGNHGCPTCKKLNWTKKANTGE